MPTLTSTPVGAANTAKFVLASTDLVVSVQAEHG